jgi:hypothetical protein
MLFRSAPRRRFPRALVRVGEPVGVQRYKLLEVVDEHLGLRVRLPPAHTLPVVGIAGASVVRCVSVQLAHHVVARPRTGRRVARPEAHVDLVVQQPPGDLRAQIVEPGALTQQDERPHSATPYRCLVGQLWVLHTDEQVHAEVPVQRDLVWLGRSEPRPDWKVARIGREPVGESAVVLQTAVDRLECERCLSPPLR